MFHRPDIEVKINTSCQVHFFAFTPMKLAQFVSVTIFSHHTTEKLLYNLSHSSCLIYVIFPDQEKQHRIGTCATDCVLI